ncbi:2OG-Fe dioxygenase family protein [Aerosakkonema funiforme]|uniref:2OG-Fe dioxygenase family protein n=1 Tax=Aerosakkonema funiforme TaxID=1246630 RepID=UPI0035B948AD
MAHIVSVQEAQLALPQLALQRVPDFDKKKWAKYIEDIKKKPDPYTPGRYRGRGGFVLALDGSPIGMLNETFVQKENEAYPNISRKFAPLPDGFVVFLSSGNVISIFQIFQEFCRSRIRELDIHLIGICSNNTEVKVVPENSHQDGTDRVGILVIDRLNIEGGETQVARSKGGKPFFSEILEPGEMLMFDDRKYWHYVTPIKSISPEPGWRFVVVLTAKLYS